MNVRTALTVSSSELRLSGSVKLLSVSGVMVTTLSMLNVDRPVDMCPVSLLGVSVQIKEKLLNHS